MTAKKKVVAKKSVPVEPDASPTMKNIVVFIIGAVIGAVLVNMFLV